jgi:hypothetical protein
MFVDMVRQDRQAATQAAAASKQQQPQQVVVGGTRPADLPVYGREFLGRE